MTVETPIDPISETEIMWQGKKIKTVVLEDSLPYISVPSFCREFSVDVANQRRRLNRKKSWFKDVRRLVNVTTPGGKQPNLCLRVDALPTFMMGVGLDNIKDEEDRVLFKAFMDESSDILAEYWGLAEVGELRFLREQVARMILEHEVDPDEKLPLDERIDRVELMVEELHNDIEGRLTTMRELFSSLREDYRAIYRVVKPDTGTARIGDKGNEGMLADVKSRVDLLANLKTVHFREDRPYPSIWNYVNMSIGGVTTYRDIPVAKYQEVIEWLDNEIMAIQKAFPAEPPEA